MPVQLENTTLSLSEISRLREIVLQTSIILNTEIDPFTIENLNKSDWWQYENARQVLSQALVAEGYDALSAFSITDINNNTLATVLVESVNESLLNGGSTSLLLIPTGAVESADGEYQRFVYDGGHAYEVASETFYPIWHAELSAQDRQSEYQIKLKMPELTDDQAVNVFITEADISLAALLELDFNYFALYLRANDGSTALLLNIADDQPNSSYVGFSQPAAGSVITLTLTTTSLDYAYDGGTGSMDIPADFFANPPNIWAYSGAMSSADVMPLSIKVAGV